MSEQTTIDDTTPDADESATQRAEIDASWQDPLPNAFRDSPARLASPDAPSHLSDSMPDLWMESDLPLKLFTEYARGLYFTNLSWSAAVPVDSSRHATFLQEVSEGKIVPPPLSVVAGDDERLMDAQGQPQLARYDRESKAICIARSSLEGALAEAAADDPPPGMPENVKLCLRIVRSFGAYVDHCITERYTGVVELENDPGGRAMASLFLVEWLRANDRGDYATARQDGQPAALSITYDAVREYVDAR